MINLKLYPHQVGLSAVETLWAKQSYECMCMEHGNVVQNYLTKNGVFKADPLFGISIHIRNSCVFVALTLIIKMGLQNAWSKQSLILQEQSFYMHMFIRRIMLILISGRWQPCILHIAITACHETKLVNSPFLILSVTKKHLRLRWIVCLLLDSFHFPIVVWYSYSFGRLLLLVHADLRWQGNELSKVSDLSSHL